MSVEDFEGLETAIAVVGMSGRFPGSRDLRTFWRNLRNGVESFTPLSDAELEAEGVPGELIRNPDYVKVAPTLEGMEEFDAGFFGFSPRDAAIMDPQQRFFLEAAWEALEDAGYPPEGISGSVGVFASSGANAYLWQNLMTNPDLVRDVGFFLLRHTGNDKDFLATRVSYLLDLTGPSINVQTACSSSLVGIHLACQSLLGGECDVAMAGGVTIRQPHRTGYLYREGEILSRDGHLRPFDAESLGTVFGSGAGVVILKRAIEAIEDGDHIYALVRGSAVNNDGAAKVGYLAPSVDGQASAVAEALAVAGVHPESIGYVESHGTGTPVGDPIEVTALTQAFRTHGARDVGYCVLGGLKSNIGHLDTAAGVAGFIKTALALHHEEIPGTLHYTTPNPAARLEESPFRLDADREAWPRESTPRRAGVNALGAGGTNAHVVLEEAPRRPSAAPPSRPWELLPLSGRSSAVVERASGRLGNHLDTIDPSDFPDVAYTLQVGRRAFPHRRALVVRSPSDAVDLLSSGESRRVVNGTASDRERSVAFLFAGGGAQYPGMGRELYETEPVYREAVDECLSLLAGEVDTDLRALLFPAEGAEEAAAAELERPSRALPALFTTQYAHARLWMSWGIAPSAMIGHSMGEYTAAVLSGVFSLADGARIVALRGRLFETLPPGAMLSIPLPADELRKILPSGLSLAAVNAPELSLASGPTEAIEAFRADLASREIEAQRLHISVAAHSSMLEPILAPFGEALRSIRFHAPEIPFASNLSGAWITAEEAMDPDYWVRHLRNTVDFAGGVGTLLEDSGRILLEVGPGRVLSTLARLHPDRSGEHEILHSMRHPGEEGSDVAFQLTALGRLWVAGLPVEWARLHSGAGRRRLPLPTYPFEHQTHWIAPGKRPDAVGEPLAGIDGTRKTDLSDWFWQPSWRKGSPAPALPARMEGERFLLWRDPGGIGARLEERLRSRGAEVLSLVTEATEGEERVAGASIDAASLERQLLEIGAKGWRPSAILHSLALSIGDDEGDPSVEDAEARALHSLVALTRAVAHVGWDTGLRLGILSRGSQRLATETGVEPLQALVLGPATVIGREFPGIRTRLIDLDPGWRADDLDADVDDVLAELLSPGSGGVAALRGRDLWERTFEPLRLPPPPAVRPTASPGSREGEVWLITGGLGGLGAVFAEELASRPGIRLVLAGRRGLPPREEWEETVASSSPHDPVARAIEAVRRIEARGATVIPAAVDVTDTDAVELLVRRVGEEVGPIHSVIHAAGVVEDALILDKEPDSAARVLAPKVRGTRALRNALRNAPPKLFVVFSSRGAVTGVAGQVDYAAANAYLDAWARARDGEDGTRVISINWSAWKEVGLAFELAREQLGIAPVRPRPVRHPLLDGVLEEEDEEDVLLFSGEFSPGRHWVLDDHRIRGGEALIPGTGYLELARGAFAHEDGGDAGRTLVLRDLYFLEPFAVPEGGSRSLRIRLSRKGEVGRFSIQGAPTHEARSGEARWREHARGVAEWSTATAPPALDLDEIRARCTRDLLEGVQERTHLDLGARWNSLERMHVGVGEALLEQTLPEAFAEELEAYQLHPALLDTATGGGQLLIDGFDEATDFYVPGSYTRLTQYAPVPSVLRSHIRWKPNSDGSRDLALFDVTVTDEAGRVVLEIEEFVMVRVDDRSRLASEEALGEAGTGPDGADGTPAPSGDAAESPSAAPPAGDAGIADEDLPPMLREAIRTVEGIEAFRRITEGRTPPQVIVSPHDLRAVLAGLDAPPASRRGGGRRAGSTPPPDTSPVADALMMHEAVQDATVKAYEDAPGTFRLVAYIVYDPIERATVSELRRHLREKVDEALVPQNFLELDRLPRDAEGALDLDALEDPFAPVDDLVEPRTETETIVAGIWMDLLGSERIGVHDNFLDIGGHSLLAMRALLRTEKETGVRLNPSVMNMHTLEQIAAEIDEERGGGEPVRADSSLAPDDGKSPESGPRREEERSEASQGLRKFFSGWRR